MTGPFAPCRVKLPAGCGTASLVAHPVTGEVNGSGPCRFRAACQYVAGAGLGAAVYRLTFANLAFDLGADTTVGEVTGDDLQRHLKARYVSAAPATHNRNLAAIQSLMAWAARKRLIAEDPTIGLERRKARRTVRQADQSRAISRRDLDALWGRTDVALRDKVLFRLIYETGLSRQRSARHRHRRRRPRRAVRAHHRQRRRLATRLLGHRHGAIAPSLDRPPTEWSALPH